MEIKIKFLGPFRDYSPQREGFICAIEVPEGSSVKDVCTQLKIPSDAPRMVLVNGLTREDSEILRAGDILSLFSPLGGG
jgi:sulfur carrier protein ThiS